MDSRLRTLTSIALCLTSSIAVAANKADKAERVVEAVLSQEARAAVPRRADDLAGALEQSDRARWAAGYIHTADGWQMFDDATTVDDRVREYEQRRGIEPLTTEQHLALANWCRDSKLTDQERAHLCAVAGDITYRPKALQRLGFKVGGGEWVTQEELTQRKDDDLRWRRELKRWLPRSQAIQKLLTNPSETNRELGRKQLTAIIDEESIPALELTLGYSTPEQSNELIQHFAKMRGTSYTRALMRQSILSPWEPTRAMAADQLRHRRPDHYVPALISTIMYPLDMQVEHAFVFLGKGIDQATGGDRFDGAYVQNITISTEKWHDTPKYVLHRMTPLVVYGREGIKGKSADVYVDGFANQFRHASLSSQPSASRVLDPDTEAAGLTSSDDVRQQIARANADIFVWNERVAQTLTRAADFPANLTPQLIWRQWALLTSTESETFKPVVTSDRIEVLEQPIIGFDRQWHSCVPAGTQIVTSAGLQPIESIRIGDTVLAKDIDTGELSYKPVIRTTVRTPQPLTTLHTKADSIRATLGHYFWVSGKGWRMAKEIKAGDRLHGVQGTVTVTDVSPGGREAVYNLVVEGANTYFVGESRILSHDVTSPVPTDIVVPGLAAR